MRVGQADSAERPAPAPRLVVLFDGEDWEQIGLRKALAHRGRQNEAVLLVPSATVEERWAVLPHPDRAAALVQSALAATRDVLGSVSAERTVVAGQSFGGLAAAAVVANRPDLATTAIAQSGSFEFRADDSPTDPAGGPGDLWASIATLDLRALTGRRFILQSGSEEAGVPELSGAFAGAIERAGARVEHRVYPGGHDYAWWRNGLFHALDQLHPATS
jgi:enterochelin esterase family protein